MDAKNSSAAVVIACLAGMVAAHLLDRILPLRPLAARTAPIAAPAPLVSGTESPVPVPVSPSRRGHSKGITVGDRRMEYSNLPLHLLAQVQDQAPAGGTRDLFRFAPPPARVVPVAAPVFVPRFPMPVSPPQPQLSTPMILPETPLFYGFADPVRVDIKRAFFLENGEIRIRAEGDWINSQYRLLRIAPSGVVVEDRSGQGRRSWPIGEAVVN
jgi:hypothetical protein